MPNSALDRNPHGIQQVHHSIWHCQVPAGMLSNDRQILIASASLRAMRESSQVLQIDENHRLMIVITKHQYNEVVVLALSSREVSSVVSKSSAAGCQKGIVHAPGSERARVLPQGPVSHGHEWGPDGLCPVYVHARRPPGHSRGKCRSQWRGIGGVLFHWPQLSDIDIGGQCGSVAYTAMRRVL